MLLRWSTLALAGISISAPGQNSAKVLAGNAYETDAAPDWVELVKPDLEAPIPASDEDSRIRAGVYYRLVDFQVNAENPATYYHFADEFITAAGVHDHSNLEIEYDPDYQTLTLHRVVLHRDGETIDVLDPGNIRVSSPEDEIGEGLLDGHVTVLILPPGVRVGDVVEYDYTITGENPSFGGLFFDRVSFQWETWVQEVRYRLLKHPNRPLFTRTHRIEIEPMRRVNSEDNLEEWIWEKRNVEPLLREEGLPGWHIPFGFLELSELETWTDVANWGRKLYDFSGETIDPELRSEVNRIQEAHEEPESRAMAAIRFVQDEVRYLGLEDGASAFCPVSPNETFRRRFGDCKDKTVLLQRMLGEMGIESDPVYVNLTGTSSVADFHPSPMAFDHVILRIQLPGNHDLWCDATRNHQGGSAGTFYFPPFSKGLVVGDSKEGLIDLPDPPLQHNRIEVVENFHLGKLKKPTQLEIVTTYSGTEADSVRYYFASRDPAEVRKHYLDYYRQNYDDIQSDGPIEIDDDRDRNRLVVTERYRFDNAWLPDESDPGWYFLETNFQTIRDGLTKPDNVERTMPYAIEHPQNRKHEIRIHLPPPLEDWEDYFDDENHLIEAPGLEFRRSVVYDPIRGMLNLIATLRSTGDAIAPEDVREYRDRVNDMYDLSSYLVWDVFEPESDESAAAGDSDGNGQNSAMPDSGSEDPADGTPQNENEDLETGPKKTFVSMSSPKNPFWVGAGGFGFGILFTGLMILLIRLLKQSPN